MALDPLERDYLDERRRKWRRSAFWRGVLATIVVLFVLGGIVGALTDPAVRPHIARLDIAETIYLDHERDQLIADMAADENVRAVILHVNSPGGTVAGSEALYENLRALAAEKPVVSVMGEVGASGAYLAAIAADHVVTRGNTLTGSIGVILEYPDMTGLMDRIGIGLVTLRSSETKAGPSPFRPLSAAERAVEEAMIADSYQWFRGLVADRRDLSGAALDAVADGRTFTGRQALDAGLVDELGGEDAARAWLESVSGDLADLEVIDWTYEEELEPIDYILGSLGRVGPDIPGIEGLAGPRLMAILR